MNYSFSSFTLGLGAGLAAAAIGTLAGTRGQEILFNHEVAERVNSAPPCQTLPIPAPGKTRGILELTQDWKNNPGLAHAKLVQQVEAVVSRFRPYYWTLDNFLGVYDEKGYPINFCQGSNGRASTYWDFRDDMTSFATLNKGYEVGDPEHYASIEKRVDNAKFDGGSHNPTLQVVLGFTREQAITNLIQPTLDFGDTRVFGPVYLGPNGIYMADIVWFSDIGM